jgi:predicted cupin superfamily sugar epimerase
VAGRSTGTAIYFLITANDFSALRRLEVDETWHFYAGDPVRLVQLSPEHPDGRVVTLGPDVLAGQTPQQGVSAGTWQGARLEDGGTRGWALLGCTMVPGWVEQEFTLGARTGLIAEFPGAAAEIARLTR